jgi:hypothetical protein
MQTPDLATQVSSWVSTLTPIALAVLVILQRMSAKKATQAAALQAETNLNTYRKVSDIHTTLTSAIPKVNEVHTIIKGGVVQVVPAPPPPIPVPPPESELDKKKKVLAEALIDLMQEVTKPRLDK